MRQLELKRRIGSGFAKHVTNRIYRFAFRLGLAPPGTAILETVGRRSGQPRQTPVTNGLDGELFWIVSEHGMKTSYVRNIEQNPSVRLLIGRRWHSGVARVAPEEDPVARLQAIREHNPASARNTWLVKAVGTDLITVRVEVDHPSRAEER